MHEQESRQLRPARVSWYAHIERAEDRHVGVSRMERGQSRRTQRVLLECIELWLEEMRRLSHERGDAVRVRPRALSRPALRLCLLPNGILSASLRVCPASGHLCIGHRRPAKAAETIGEALVEVPLCARIDRDLRRADDRSAESGVGEADWRERIDHLVGVRSRNVLAPHAVRLEWAVG
ncbi:MAG TPA: hypothetical protein VHB25_11750 [Gemmatimonadaceae bacterium]|nr:hypothetical protein [Gemmatimonadaceae bacterium]